METNTPTIASQGTAADAPPNLDKSTAVPTPAFSIDFPTVEGNGENDEFLVAKHIDQMFQVTANNVEDAMAKVLAEEHSSDVVQLAEHVTVDCDSNMDVSDFTDGEGVEDE